MDLAQVTTGTALKTWREANGMKADDFAESICRMQTAVDFWESSSDNLTKHTIATLHVYHGKDGEHRGSNDTQNIVWDSFNDSPTPAEFEARERLRRDFNSVTMQTTNAIDRLAYTDVETAMHFYGKGTIWLASNECQAGRNVGDRVLRRIVENFHSRQSDPAFTDPDRSKGKRHLYQFDDAKTKKKYWVSAKAVEDRTPAAKNTVHYVIAVSSDVHPHPVLQDHSRGVAHQLREHLESTGVRFD